MLRAHKGNAKVEVFNCPKQACVGGIWYPTGGDTSGDCGNIGR